MSNSHPAQRYQLAATELPSVLSSFDISLGKEIIEKLATINLGELVNDSRQVKTDDVFCAIIGHEQDGNAYIEKAIQQGASVVIAQCQLQSEHGNTEWLNAHNRLVLKISFYQLAQQSFELASAYYHAPQTQQTLIGITGTNGKTSTSQICAHLLSAVNEQAGNNCAVIGTNGAGLLGQLKEINNTTPGSMELMSLLAKFNAQSVSHVAMEVSSHAMSQQRVSSEMFDVAVFTNLSRDHLDYHQTMENYAQAKFSLFAASSAQIAIFNVADSYGAKFYQQLLAQRNDDAKNMVAYALNGSSLHNNKPDDQQAQYPQFVFAENVTHHANGVNFILKTHCGEQQINSPLLGDFNIENLLAAIAVLVSQNVTLDKIAHAVRGLTPVAGRMECFAQDNLPTTIVDYAHTPDALENALIAARQHCNGALWAVFGCGGNRDKGKRSLMGKVAENSADQIVLTNDNPRNEQPEDIVNDILSGCQAPEKITVCLDRQQAVTNTLNQASADDVILLAGKGHEDYIVIGNEKINYDERALVRSLYRAKQQAGQTV